MHAWHLLAAPHSARPPRSLQHCDMCGAEDPVLRLSLSSRIRPQTQLAVSLGSRQQVTTASRAGDTAHTGHARSRLPCHCLRLSPLQRSGQPGGADWLLLAGGSCRWWSMWRRCPTSGRLTMAPPSYGQRARMALPSPCLCAGTVSSARWTAATRCCCKRGWRAWVIAWPGPGKAGTCAVGGVVLEQASTCLLGLPPPLT